jgi:hypothetical protein
MLFRKKNQSTQNSNDNDVDIQWGGYYMSKKTVSLVYFAKKIWSID